MKKILTLIFVLLTRYLIAQTGADCTTAILVSSSGCSGATAYNNTGVTGTLTPPSCFTTGNNNGMWFYFVASTANVVATVNGGSLTLPQVSVLSPPAGGCGGGTFTQLACASPGTISATATVAGGLTPGNTYYIYVDGQNNTVGTFQLCLTSPTVPPNDNPCSAITPPSITNWCSPTAAYTTTGSSPDVLPPCFNQTGTANTVWFSFVPTQIGIDIVIDGGTSGMLPQVAIVQPVTTCSGTTWSPITCAQAAAGATSVTLSSNFMAPGQTYYILVSGQNGADGTFSICVNNHAVTSTVPNDQCTGAIPICPSQHYYGTTAGATATNDIPIFDNNGNFIWNCNGVINNVVWYTFVATTPPQNVVFSVNWDSYGLDGYPGGALQFEVFDYTGPGVPCAHDGSTTPGYWTSLTSTTDLPCGGASTGPGTETIPASSLVAGRTYYLVIDNFPNDTVTYNFSATGVQGTTAGNDTTICVNSAPVTLIGGSPTGGTWSGPGITNASTGTFSPSGLSAGSYTVYYTKNTCTDAKSITLQGPTVNVSNDDTVCPGGSAQLAGNIVEYPSSYPVTFSNNTTYAIPDNTAGGVSSVIAVSGISPNTVGTNPIVSVCLDITHPFDDDLKITLKCPGGTTITLVPANNYGLGGTDFTSTCFVTGSPSITAATPPYTGSYAPSQPFSNLNACIVDGNWTLKVVDNAGGDVGNLVDWSITFNNTPAAPTYAWTPVTNMTNSTTLSPTVTPTSAGTTSYILTATDALGCIARDTVKVTQSPKPNAGPDQTICQYTTATLAGVGTGTWSIQTGNPATTVVTTPSSATSTVTGFTVAGAYYYIWTVNGCTDTVKITVTAKPSAGVDQSIPCFSSGTATMAASGVGTWTAQAGNPGTATITTPTSPTTTITAFSATGTYNFIWTSGGCTDTAKVVAGNACVCASPPTVTLTTHTGSICYNTVSQTIGGTYGGSTSLVTPTSSGTGTFAPTSASATPFSFTYTPSAADIASGSVTLTFTTNNPLGAPCTASSDNYTLTIYPKPNAGADQTICEYTTATMAAVGVGAWSTPAGNPAVTTITTPASATSTITGFTAPGAYLYIWTVNGCTETVKVTVTAKPNAGADQTICQYTTATMAGVGVGTWSTPAGNPAVTTITTPASATTTITGFTAAGAYTYIWTVNGCTDTMVVNVTAKPNAGIDQTICQYTTATMAGVGVGAWSTPAGNPAVTTITTPASATTTITGFTAAGAYSYIWTVNGCTDTMVVNVTAKPNAGIDQTICEYTSTSLAAIGAGNWSIPAGNPAVTNITTYGSGTSTVFGFTAPGAYYYIWTVNGCTDTMVVNVTAKPNAGVDQTICEYTTATMAAVGVGTWSTPAGNPAVTTITTPASATSTITGFTAAGAYTFIWTANGCTDTMVVNVTAKPNAGADQTICQYTTATMAGVGVGTWSTPTGNPAVTTITTPASATTTITGFTAAGAYTYIWTVNGCTDTMVVNVTAKPNAGIDQTICQYTTATMAAAGVGAWSTPAGNPAVTTITTPASASTTITGFTAAGAYKYIWTVNGCTDTMVVNVTAKPNAGADQTICEYTTATMAAVGVGVWSTPAGNPAVTTITTPASATSTITGFTAPGAYTYIWTVNGCTDTTVVNITAKPNAGADQTICQYTTATMAGVGVGAWSTPAGNPAVTTITTPASATTTITGFTAAGAYSYIWTVNGCTDTMVVNVTAKPNAGADQALCLNTTATMAALGVGVWSTPVGNPAATTITNPASATTTITGFTAAGAYSFVWTVNGCTDTIVVIANAQPSAGADQTVCQYTSATMGGVGVGTWSALATNPSPTVITSPSSANAVITGFDLASVYSFVYVLGTCTDTMNVTVTAKPNAGPDQTICQNTSATMSAIGIGNWTTLAGNPAATTIATPASATTTITGFTIAGAYSFIWTVNGCTDTTIVNVTPTPDAGADQTICQYTDAAMTAVGTGIWSTPAGNPAVTNIATPTSGTTTITGFAISGAYTFVWTVNGCNDTTIVNVTAKPDAGPDQVVCQYTSATMAGIGSGTWTDVPSNPTATVIATPGSSSTTITGFDQAGTYSFVWTVNGCTDTMNVVVTAKPNAGADQVICQYTSTTMAAAGAGIWTDIAATNPGPTVIVSPNSANTSISGFDQSGVYSFVWTVNGCTDTVNINVTAKPDAGPDLNVCQNADATMAGVGVGTWSDISTNPSIATINNPTQANTTISGLIFVGTYSFVWTVNGCTDTMNVVVSTQPTVTIADSSICIGDSTTMIAVAVPTGGSYLWGDGEITSSIRVSPTIATPYDVTYTLGICTAQATGNVTVNLLPAVTVATSNTICTANNGTAEANVVGAAPYTYLWSAPGGNTDTIRHLTVGTYTVTVRDNLGCKDTASGTVGIDTPSVPIILMSVHELKCNDDSTGSININVVDSGVIVFNWSNNTAAQNATHLPAGSYQVTVTDQFGCTGTGQYTVTQPPQLVLAVPTPHTDPLCHGGSDGTATENASGGSGNYSYLWNTTPPQITQQATGLSAGTYMVTVTDDSGCVATAPVTLVDPSAITFGPSVVTDARCFGSSDGTAQIFPQGGAGVYQYQWGDSASQITNPAGSLKAGTYIVTVTDARGCTATVSVTVGQPPQLTVDVTHTDLTCFQNNSGTALASASGGTPPYSYVWNDNANTAQVSNLRATTYMVTATDGHGCRTTGTTTLNQPTQVLLVRASFSTNCAASSDGSITANASGGTGTFTYVLKDASGTTLQTNQIGVFSGLAPQLYTVIASDQNGCTVSDTVTVPRAAFNVYSSIADSTSCYGAQYHDGSIHIQGFTIQNGPFRFSVDSGPYQFIPDFYDLAAGVHIVHVEDAHQCDTSFGVIVGEPIPASVDILPGDSTIILGSTLQLSTVFGPYSSDSIKGYTWSPGEGLSCIDCPAPTVDPYGTQNVYTVTVTYNQGCLAVATVRINVEGEPPVYVPNAFSPNGDGTNDVFYVYGDGIKTMQLRIFNRWGEKVYESNNQSDGWDGTYKGQLQPPGVYVYTVDLIYLNNRTRFKDGSVTLIR